MPEQTKSARGYLWRYAATLACLVALCFLAYLNQRSYRTNPIDFAAMPDGSYVPTRSLTRLQREEIKLAYVESAPPPQFGLFGNHQVQFMSRASFGPDTKHGYFFNYAYANLGLPEIYDYLSYLLEKKKLPTESLVVQITTPNNDRGLHILTYAYELPPDISHFATKPAELGGRHLGYGDDVLRRLISVREKYLSPWISRYPLLERYYETLPSSQRLLFLQLEGFFQGFAHLLHQSLNYATVGASLSALLRRGVDTRVVAGASCAEKDADLVSKVLTGGVACTKADLHMAFRGDGSYDARFYRNKPLTQNENVTDQEGIHLKPGDEVAIAGFMDRICKLVTAQGRKCAFLIPPVHETERASVPDTILSKALALVPHIAVIDDRDVRDRKYFHDYDHPNSAYYERLVSVLRQRGLAPEAAQ